MDLDKAFATNKELEDEGAPFWLEEENKGAVIFVRRLTYPKYQAALKLLVQKNPRLRRGKDLARWERFLNEKNKELVPKYLIVNWKDITRSVKNGKKVPTYTLDYSVENALVLCAEVPEIVTMVLDFAADMGNFKDQDETDEEDETVVMPASVVDIAKKSRSE